MHGVALIKTATVLMQRSMLGKEGNEWKILPLEFLRGIGGKALRVAIVVREIAIRAERPEK